MREGAISTSLSPRLLETVAWCSLLVAIPFVAVDVLCGVWDHDGGFYLQRGFYVASGLKPYLDFGSIYPPLGDLLTAAVIRIGISHIAIAIALPIAWVLATALTTGLLIYGGTGNRGAAILIASLVPWFSAENGGNHMTLEHCVAVFSCLAFAPLVRHTELTPATAARALFFATAAALCKQTGAVAVLVVLVAFFERRREMTRRHWIASLSAAVSIPAALLVWLEFNFVGVYQNIFLQLSRYAGESDAPSPAVILREFTRSPGTAWLLLATILLGAMLVVVLPRNRLLAAAGVAGVIIQFWPRLLRDYSHYNLNIWPFVALVLALALTYGPRFIPDALRIFLLFFAIIVNAQLAFDKVHAELNSLTTAFYPAAKSVASLTPPEAVVRQYGTDAIIEFLAYRREEVIERSWGPNAEYPTPPHRSTTIVVVGRRFDVALHKKLQQQGFVVVEQIQAAPLVTILRHRESVPR